MREKRKERILPFVTAAVIVCVIMALAPRSALAHAVLVHSHPAVDGVVTGPDVAILLQYNSRIDPARSTLSLLAPDGKVSQVATEGSSPSLLSAKATGLAKGAYVLRWQVLATDGHITRGEIPFRVQ